MLPEIPVFQYRFIYNVTSRKLIHQFYTTRSQPSQVTEEYLQPESLGNSNFLNGTLNVSEPAETNCGSDKDEPSDRSGRKPKQNSKIDDDETRKKMKLKRIAKVAGIATAGAVVTGVGAVLAAPLVIGAAGFGAAGVAAWSVAAAWQASIGAVASGSLFASLQSAGVKGFAASTNAAIGATAAGAVGIGGGVAAAVATADKHGEKSTPPSDPPGNEEHGIPCSENFDKGTCNITEYKKYSRTVATQIP